MSFSNCTHVGNHPQQSQEHFHPSGVRSLLCPFRSPPHTHTHTHTHTHMHAICFLSPEVLPASGVPPMAPWRARSVSLSPRSVSDTPPSCHTCRLSAFIAAFCHLHVASVRRINSPSPFLFICSGVVSVWGCYKHHWIICVDRCLFPLVNIWERGPLGPRWFHFVTNLQVVLQLEDLLPHQ